MLTNLKPVPTSDMFADEYGDQINRYIAGRDLTEFRRELLNLGFRFDQVDSMTVQNEDVSW